MTEFTYTITDANGLHARPAARLVTAASDFESEIKLYYKEKCVNMKGLFAVMSLGVNAGETVRVTVSGKDETEAAKQLEEFFENNL